MTKNVGSIDKIIRIIIGVILLIAGFSVSMNTGWRIGVFVLAGMALATAFFST